MSLANSEHSIRSGSTWNSSTVNSQGSFDSEASARSSPSPAFVPRKRTSNLQSSSHSLSSASSTYTGFLSTFVQTPFSTSFVRWYVVAMACGLQAVNGLMWMTWGPISSTAEAVFGWGDPVIALQNGIGGLVLVPLCVPAAWLLENGGQTFPPAFLLIEMLLILLFIREEFMILFRDSVLVCHILHLTVCWLYVAPHPLSFEPTSSSDSV